MAKGLFTKPLLRSQPTRSPLTNTWSYSTRRKLATVTSSPVSKPAPAPAAAPPFIPCIDAPDLTTAKQLSHLSRVDSHLKKHGILKINLRFQDAQSHYLRDLVLGLHQHHDHQLPITHSATRGWFWDVRPTPSSVASAEAEAQAKAAASSPHLARSETMQCFPWHTDCSYEVRSPQYFALQVIQNDRRGGGTLSIMNVRRLVETLPGEARDALARPEFEISIPPEFIKSEETRKITGRLLTLDDTSSSGGESDAVGEAGLRYREDIVSPMTERAAWGLEELRSALPRAAEAVQSTVHLSSTPDMPNGSVLLVNNRRWLHARSEVRDPDRHLRRIRWDAVEF